MEKDNNFVEAIAQLAITCEKLGYHHESDEYIQKSINLAENIGNGSSLAVVYNCAGILFKAWNKYDKATPFFEKCQILRCVCCKKSNKNATDATENATAQKYDARRYFLPQQPSSYLISIKSYSTSKKKIFRKNSKIFFFSL